MQAETAIVDDEIEKIDAPELSGQPTQSGQAGAEGDHASKIDLQPPPFAEVHEGPELDKAQVTIELTNSSRIKGRLAQFNAASETISIYEPRANEPTTVEM